MKQIVVIVSILALAAFGLSCNSGDGDKAAGGRQFLSLGTAPAGGAFFTIGSALAGVLNEYCAPSG